MRTFSILTTLVATLFSFSSFALTGFKSAVLFDGRVIDLGSDVLSFNLNQGQLDFLELQDGEIIDRTDIKSIILQNKIDSQNSRSRIGVDGGGM